MKSVEGADAEVARMEERLIGTLDQWLSVKIADLGFDLPAKSPVDGTWIIRTHAAAIGDLEADAFYWYANRDGKAPGADVAIVHGGGIRDGCSYEEIADKLYVSRSRVNRVVESIYAKLGVHGKSRLGDYVW